MSIVYTGIKKVLKIPNVDDSEVAALIEKLNLDENEKSLDFSTFLVRFGALPTYVLYTMCMYAQTHIYVYQYIYQFCHTF